MTLHMTQDLNFKNVLEDEFLSCLLFVRVCCEDSVTAS
jgi:hypothetical protein